MTIFYTSDIHFSHANIIKFCNRPFKDTDHMDEMIIKYWNETVEPDDTIFVLGDVALGPIATSLPHVSRLAGHKILVPGNHDRCWKGMSKFSDEWVHRYLDAGFEEIIHGHAWAWMNDTNVRMCHFPFEGDSHGEDRFKEFRPVRKYDTDFIIHGHVHDAWKVKDRQINVGMDVWDFRPVSHDTISGMMTSIKGKAGDTQPSVPFMYGMRPVTT